MRTRRIPVVSSLAAAISEVGLDAGDHRLDCEHYPHLRQLALAHTWTSVGAASWLGNAAGIWMRGNGRCNYRFAPDHTTGSAAMRNRRIGVRWIAPDAAISCIFVPSRVISEEIRLIL